MKLSEAVLTKDMMYPFIDIAVHKAIRTLFSEGEALAVVTPDFSELIWANGVAARLFGHASIYDFLDSGFIEDKEKKKKLKDTAQQLMDNTIISSANLQISSKDGVSELDLTLKLIHLPRGEQAVLLIINGHNTPRYGILDVEHIIAGFADTGTCVAVLGNQGQILGATEQFYALDVSLKVRRDLTDEVSSEQDRLVKRLIGTNKGKLPAAIGHLTSSPDMFLLFAIDEDAEISGADVKPVRQSDPVDDPLALQTIQAEQDKAFGDNADVVAEPKLIDRPAVESSESGPADIMTGAEMTGADRQKSDDDSADPDETASAAPDFVFNPDQRTVRFVWRTDAATIFTEISPELSAALGPNAADIVGRRFTDVALVFNLTPRDEIIELIRRRDTWSGKTVLWPVQGTNLRVPVDLAALPTYTRDRLFDGYRGFGVARIQEAVQDPEELGFSLSLRQNTNDDRDQTPSNEKTLSATQSDGDGKNNHVAQGNSIDANLSDDNSRDADRLTSAKPVPEVKKTEVKKVVQLDKLRRQAEENLSEDEQAAFFEIRRHLSKINSDMDNARDSDVSDTGVSDKPDDEPLEHPVIQEDSLNTTKDISAGGEDAPASDEPPMAVDRSDDTSLGEDKLTVQNIEPSELMKIEDVAQFNENLDEDGADASGLEESEALEQDHYVNDADQIEQLDLALRESRAQNERLQSKLSDLNSMLETATDGIVIFDEDNTIQSLNASASALFDYDQSDMVGEPFTILFAPQSQNSVLDYIHAMKDHGVASILNDGREVLALVSSGGTLPLSMTIGHLGGSGGYCAVLRDLSQSKKAEKELTSAKSVAEKANAHKTDFLTRVSHEIRTPLNAIIGFADMISQERFGLVGHSRYVEYAHDIGKSGRHVLDIVNDLLDISKIEAGKQELEFQSVSLNDEITSALSLMHPLANESRVIVRSSLPSNVPNVVADQRSIKQILLNILSNSIKHTPAGGQVVVSSSLEATGHVLLRIRDTGKGMTRTELERALQPFGQVGDHTRDQGEGTGLGLPLTRAMAEANRANFDIVSAPGDGTLVTINFPPQRVLTE